MVGGGPAPGFGAQMGAPGPFGPPAAALLPTAASAVFPTLDADLVAPDAPRILAAFLVTFEGDERGTFYPLRQGVTVVGRKDAGETVDVPIDHPTTSSRHARFFVAARPTRIKLEDLSSTNGTYVNDRRLEPSQRQSLSLGDTVRFGGISFVLVML